ncbi:hypothetical protein Gxy13693_077_005 [Komagataeibacter xylinus NBRC 13693]|uniref:Uncharacterized protein n=1 Tax=Komagataeibacter xylinus NBRC 13693 TaxID=1234668 RepID=A0A0D6QDQ4_KOMXY|nr:hypothetical protein [Komagataeibacter xylinus]GAO00977.1 hypothetical protein Gxy13693_077_005 [Komagataeibacter xylinus NBRC 13693]
MCEALNNVIPPAAQAERVDGNPREARDISLLSAEYQQLQAEHNKYNREKQDIENRKAKMEIAMMRLDLRMKNKFSKNVFAFLWAFSGFCALILAIQGFNPKLDFHIHNDHFWNIEFRINGFCINDTPLTTLIGGTAASAIGLVAIVLRGLFNSGAAEQKSPSDLKSVADSKSDKK